MSESSSSKRKRSSIACTVCHGRKVRCNVASTGVPCSNCVHDGTVCRIYGRRPSIGPERPIRPRIATTDEPMYPPTPSTVVSSITTGPHNESQAAPTPSTGIPTNSELTPRDHETTSGHESGDRPASPTTTGAPMVPFHSGESVGLDFLFDICHPSRPFKGNIYIINRRRQVLPEPELLKRLDESKPLPSPAVRQDLIRGYFHYVHPVLPVINATTFLQAYHHDVHKISKLLIWSIFFAAASFISTARLQETGFPDRRALKDDIYLHAKELFDLHAEIDKTSIIQSALLLSYYHIDLEDLDGSWYWIGIATHLCHTIGLHRDAKWHRLPRSPFHASQYAIWRRLWWCCYYREAWLALGYGRPMRTRSEDMDTPFPTIGDVVDELERLPLELRHTYIPTEMPTLVALWLVFLRMMEKLEVVLSVNYRIKRPPITLAILEHHDTQLWQLYQQVHDIQGQQQPSRLQMLHTHLLKTYYNSIVVALFRPYIMNTPEQMPKVDQERLKVIAADRCRLAASNTTYSLNELVYSDLIDVCPTTLTTSMTSSMQIHVYEYYFLEGLSKQHALHNLKLHIMVLDHLRKTHWTAELQHKLFSETLAAMESSTKGSAPRASSKDAESTSAPMQPEYLRQDDVPVPATMEGSHVSDFDLADAQILPTGTELLDDSFVTFDPFNGPPNPFNDWELGSGSIP